MTCLCWKDTLRMKPLEVIGQPIVNFSDFLLHKQVIHKFIDRLIAQLSLKHRFYMLKSNGDRSKMLS